jgi:ADP-ribose pyrophosphatase YjhB (NUDIX family)
LERLRSEVLKMKTSEPIKPPPETWRAGTKVPLNVYEGDRPVCQCHNVEDATRIVAAMNGERAKLPHVGAVAIACTDDGRILLGRRNKEPLRGMWVFPGGGIRPMERIADAAQREAFEETGARIEVYGDFAVREILNPPHEHRIAIFRIASVSKTAQFIPNTDMLEVGLFTVEHAFTLELTPTTRDVLEEFALHGPPLGVQAQTDGG